MNPLGDVNTPVYVWDEESFENNIYNMKEAFECYYPRFNIAYSYKTNYATAICKKIASLGCLAEVVSPMEFSHAVKINPVDKIVYNGVIRDDYNKVQVATNGGKVNVDNLQELKAIEEIAKANGLVAKIGLRLNFPIGNGVVSRFGIEAFSYDFNEAISTLEDSEHLKLVGIHCHISKARELEYWADRVDKMLGCFTVLECRGVLDDIEYIDLGSNMYGPMVESLAIQFSDNKIPTYGDYARCIGEPLFYRFSHWKNPPLLIIEAGTPVVSNTMSVLSRVVGIKEVEGKQFVTMDCSTFNLGAISKVKTVPMDIVFKSTNRRIKLNHAVIAGYTCIEDDVINYDYTGSLAIGDVVRFSNVGAYSMTFSPHFIMPTIGMINEQGKLLRKSSSFEAPFREDIRK